jgi:DNA-binding NarL/FixJ family response regulator
MSVLLYSADLTVMSRVQGAATAAGSRARVVNSIGALDEALGEEQLVLVIDLSAPNVDIAALVENFKAASPSGRVVAFGPHVHEQRLAAAREAGCDEVMSRGQFFAQVDALLK